ncbi:MAG: hypothetical protein AAFR11_06065 [Pseudomonadota bacterium]
MTASRAETSGVAAQFSSVLPPAALSLAGVVALALPLRLFEAAAPTPILPLLVVYHWSASAPDRFPAPAILAIGLLQDFLLGAPLGQFAAAYLAIRWLTLTQSDFLYGRDGGAMWAGAAATAAVAGAILWLTTSLTAGGFAPVWPAVAQIGLTVLFYPPLSRLFDRIIGARGREAI